MIFNINDYTNFYFVGIGGISMSSLALILKRDGKNVKGYDRRRSDATKSLENEGIEIFYECDELNSKGCDIAVYTAAVDMSHPEIQNVASNGIPLISRAELLGAIAKSYPNSIAVAGTHGKSTTCGILSQIFLSLNGADPTILIGAKLPSISSTFRTGHDRNFVFEACEYKDSFLQFYPTVSVILNVELDHTDYFSCIEQMDESFNHFMNNTAKDGCVIVNKDSEHAMLCTKGCERKLYTYSVKDETADFYAKNIHFVDGLPGYTLVFKGREVFEAELSIPGVHNISNSLAAVAAAFMSKVPDDAIIKGLKDFRGVGRRFEFKGTLNGAKVYDDYAHHPDEVIATLSAAKRLCGGRLISVFQPHTFSRTYDLLDSFKQSFDNADIKVFADIFPAREENIYGISSEHIAEGMENAVCIDSFQGIADYLRANVREGDTVIIMGAGDIDQVAKLLF
ncbi:MAG: UDP-N-acetylmuramate--L-alanine ligase [Clostridia bacterium]|nr:UDP-N-acetylmuramate--L-alanine ligase [Clostridia bacterium]MBQ7047318.1 UDP-N-acetylmuramate--L-alanine ligase [Clostridia bacterium]